MQAFGYFFLLNKMQFFLRMSKKSCTFAPFFRKMYNGQWTMDDGQKCLV